MIKAICDISGKSPAVPVSIVADGATVLQLDLCPAELAALVQRIRDKMLVTDVTAVMKKQASETAIVAAADSASEIP